MRRCLLLLLGLPLLAGAERTESERIAAERQELIEHFAQEELDCRHRFAVNACVDDVHRRRREALEPLRAQELELEDAERQRRAAQRRAAIEARQRERAARPPALPEPERPPRPPAEPASVAEAASVAPAATVPLVPGPGDDAQERAAQADERVRAAQRRRVDIEAALERVRQRVAEREAAGQAATPLPVPEAASAARP